MEVAFKLAFALVLASVVAAVGVAVRSLRTRPDGQLNQTPNELAVLKVIRPLFGLAFYAALFDWLLPGTRAEFAFLPVPHAIRWTGAATAFAAVALLWRSFVAMGRNYRGGVGLWDDHELVVTGPYRVIRHPIYLAFVLLTLGVGVLAANWVIGASGVLLTLAIPVWRLPVEERELRERFGSTWLEYRAATPGFLPLPIRRP